MFEGYWGAAAIACLSYSQQMSHLRVLILAMCTSKCVSTGPWVVFRFNKPIGVEPKSVTHWNRLSHSYSLDLKSHSSSPLIISNNFLIFSFLNVLSGQIVEKMGLFHSKIFQTPPKKLINVREGLPVQKVPKYRHCLNGGGSDPCLDFYEGFVHMH